MKAKPVRIVDGVGYVQCNIAECTHVSLYLPGPTKRLTLPVILHGTRKGTNCWSWNGDINKPTLKPSVSTKGSDADGEFKCHSWITDGKIEFLHDTTHALVGQTVDLIDVDSK